MSFTYSLLPNTTAVLRSDGAMIPSDPRNADWQDYQAWLGVGNVPTPVPPPTLAQQAVAMLAAGFQLTSTSTPALNGTYGCDPTSQSIVQSEIIALLLNAKFTNGNAAFAHFDKGGGQHSFSATQFKAFATAIAQFIGTLLPIVATNSGTLPTQPTTIA